jgi:hypothetical protein
MFRRPPKNPPRAEPKMPRIILPSTEFFVFMILPATHPMMAPITTETSSLTNMAETSFAFQKRNSKKAVPSIFGDYEIRSP